MGKKVIVSEAVRNFADYINRVAYRGESFTLIRGNKPVAELASTGKMIGPHDLWIAAACIAHGLTLVTANVREFQRVPGLAIESWPSGTSVQQERSGRVS